MLHNQARYQDIKKRLGAQPTFVSQTESLRKSIHHTAAKKNVTDALLQSRDLRPRRAEEMMWQQLKELIDFWMLYKRSKNEKLI